MVRNWWKNDETPHREKEMVERFTTHFITPILWSEEVHKIESDETKFDNLTVTARPNVREVVANYRLQNDEGNMELTVQIPANFPLGTMNIESGPRVGVDGEQWRTWLLQLTTYLVVQNGSILDALGVWKRNVDTKFAGVEECHICFFVLHGTNHQIPKLACNTCKNKFHSACLYKWFSSSNNSTCPLCRNLF